MTVREPLFSAARLSDHAFVNGLIENADGEVVEVGATVSVEREGVEALSAWGRSPGL